MSEEPNWEKVTSDPPTYRLRVQAGWLYRVGGPYDLTGLPCFVPDVVRMYDIVQRISRGAPLFVKGH